MRFVFSIGAGKPKDKKKMQKDKHYIHKTPSDEDLTLVLGYFDGKKDTLKGKDTLKENDVYRFSGKISDKAIEGEFQPIKKHEKVVMAVLAILIFAVTFFIGYLFASSNDYAIVIGLVVASILTGGFLVLAIVLWKKEKDAYISLLDDFMKTNYCAERS